MPESVVVASESKYTQHHRKYHLANRDAKIAKMKEYYIANQERLKAKRRANYANKKISRLATVEEKENSDELEDE